MSTELHPSTVQWLDRSIAEVTEYSDHNPTDTDAARAVIHLRRLRAFVDAQGTKTDAPRVAVTARGFGAAFYC